MHGVNSLVTRHAGITERRGYHVEFGVEPYFLLYFLPTWVCVTKITSRFHVLACFLV